MPISPQLEKADIDAINILGKAFLRCQDPQEFDARATLVRAIRYLRFGIFHIKHGAKRKASARWRKNQQKEQGRNIWD